MRKLAIGTCNEMNKVISQKYLFYIYHVIKIFDVFRNCRKGKKGAPCWAQG